MGWRRSGEQADQEHDDLAERYRDDMVVFTPGPHDVRVARGGWVFYVRAVRGAEALLGPRFGVAGAVMSTAITIALVGRPWRVQVLVLAGWFALILCAAGWQWLRVRDLPWRVGVVRGPDPATWNAGPPTLEHEVVLERGRAPGETVAALAGDVRAGRFDPVGGS